MPLPPETQLFETPIASSTGTLTSASQIKMSDSTSAEDAISNLRAQILGYQFNSSVTDATNPGASHVAFNSAAKASATIISFNTTSNVSTARFDELLGAFVSGDRIFAQEQDNIANAILFRITGTPTVSGSSVNVPVIAERTQGGEFTNDANVNFSLFWTGARTSTNIPISFLNEVTPRSVPQLGTQVTTQSDVRFWFRSIQITSANVGDTTNGLLLGNSNGGGAGGTGTDRRNEKEFIDPDNDHIGEYLYLALDEPFVNSITTTSYVVAILDADSNIIQLLNLGNDFNAIGQLGLGSDDTFFQSSSGGFGGQFPDFDAGQTIALYEIGTPATVFEVSETNAPDVDLTLAVKDLQQPQLDSLTRSKIDMQTGAGREGDYIQNQFTLTRSTTAAGQSLTGDTALYYLFPQDEFNNDIETSWRSTTFDVGIPPNTSTESRTFFVAVDNVYDFENLSGSESGTATLSIVDPGVAGFNIYEAVMPASTTSTNVFSPVGTETTISLIRPTNAFQIDQQNITEDYRRIIENGSSPDLASLTSKVNVLFPLSGDVSILTDWADVYDPEHTTENVSIVDGYSLIADFRGTTSAEHYESPGVTYVDGTNVIDYTGLTDNLHRTFGFKVSAPADTTLLYLDDSGTLIPFIRTISAGSYQINNFTPARTSTEDVTNHTTFLTRSSGVENVTTAEGSFSRFVIPDFPASATNVARRMSFNLDVIIGGTDTLAGEFINIDLPATNVTQSRVEITRSIYLGPLHGNRSETVTIGYRLLTVGADYVIHFSVQSAPSDVAIRFTDVALFQDYTTTSVIAREDDWNTFGTGAGNYTFTGEDEIIITFQPIANGTILRAVGAAVDSAGAITLLNDINIAPPSPLWDAVQIPDTIEFRTFVSDHFLIHNDLRNLLGDRSTMWAYARARLNVVTGRGFNEPVDLASGSTIGGQAISTGGSRSWVESQAFAGVATELTVNLPTNTTLSDFVFVEITWHTGVGTATDNNNRNYTELGSIAAILNASDDELILGGRGRGADNYGIEINTSSVSDSDTSLLMDIINLNDGAGATLPASSAITAVRFY